MTASFLDDIRRNPANAAILERWEALGLADAWLVAGCLFQTIWNLQAGRPTESAIKDYDIFYFDATDLSDGAERRVQARVTATLSDLGINAEVCNQARVHLWYPEYFGRPYPKLTSSVDGIRRFLVRETCVGVRPGECYAPFGLCGIYSGTLSPNPNLPYPELFARKVASCQGRWPHLKLCNDESNDA